MALKIGNMLLVGATLAMTAGSAFAQTADAVQIFDGKDTGRYRVGNDGRIRGLDQAYTPEQFDVVQFADGNLLVNILALVRRAGHPVVDGRGASRDIHCSFMPT